MPFDFYIHHHPANWNAGRHCEGNLVIHQSRVPLPGGSRSHGPTRVNSLHPNGFSIGSAVFARLTVVSNTQTEHVRHIRSSNMPHLASTIAMRSDREAVIKYSVQLRFIKREAFEKCWAHSPLRATARRLF